MRLQASLHHGREAGLPHLVPGRRSSVRAEVPRQGRVDHTGGSGLQGLRHAGGQLLARQKPLEIALTKPTAPRLHSAGSAVTFWQGSPSPHAL